jgi:chromosome segregation ATPase
MANASSANDDLRATLARIERLIESSGRETKLQLQEQKLEIERLSRAIQALNADDKLLRVEIEKLRSRVETIEDDVRRAKRESHEGDHMTQAALESAMAIASKRDAAAAERDARLEVLIADVAQKHQVVIDLFGIKRTFRVAAAVFLGGSFFAGVILALVAHFFPGAK